MNARAAVAAAGRGELRHSARGWAAPAGSPALIAGWTSPREHRRLRSHAASWRARGLRAVAGAGSRSPWRAGARPGLFSSGAALSTRFGALADPSRRSTAAHALLDAAFRVVLVTRAPCAPARRAPPRGSEHVWSPSRPAPSRLPSHRASPLAPASRRTRVGSVATALQKPSGRAPIAARRPRHASPQPVKLHAPSGSSTGARRAAPVDDRGPRASEEARDRAGRSAGHPAADSRTAASMRRCVARLRARYGRPRAAPPPACSAPRHRHAPRRPAAGRCSGGRRRTI